MRIPWAFETLRQYHQHQPERHRPCDIGSRATERRFRALRGLLNNTCALEYFPAVVLTTDFLTRGLRNMSLNLPTHGAGDLLYCGLFLPHPRDQTGGRKTCKNRSPVLAVGTGAKLCTAICVEARGYPTKKGFFQSKIQNARLHNHRSKSPLAFRCSSSNSAE